LILVSAGVLGVAVGKQPWFWASADAIALLLLVGNLALIAAVYVQRLVRTVRGWRERRCRPLVQELLADLEGDGPGATDLASVGTRVGQLGGVERSVAATMLVERLEAASEEERERVRVTLRAVGAVESLVRSAGRCVVPSRRALAVVTLGRIGAPEAVPALLDRLSDRSRYVRECAVRSLGWIGDARSLPALAEFFRRPGSVSPGVVYDALVAFGSSAELVFAEELRSPLESARVAACFGVAALSEPEQAGRLLAQLLVDGSGRVRAAAAGALGDRGGVEVPEALARSLLDDEPAVRTAAVGALGFFDDPRSVQLLLNALLDADRDTVVRASESLLRLSRLRNSGAAAADAVASRDGAWPLERARALAALGVA
jgi:HEAT repeat protein